DRPKDNPRNQRRLANAVARGAGELDRLFNRQQSLTQVPKERKLPLLWLLRFQFARLAPRERPIDETLRVIAERRKFKDQVLVHLHGSDKLIQLRLQFIDQRDNGSAIDSPIAGGRGIS